MPTCYLGQRLSRSQGNSHNTPRGMIGGRKAASRNKKRRALSWPVWFYLTACVSGNNVRAALMTAQESVRREITHRLAVCGRESITSGRNRRVSLGFRKMLVRAVPSMTQYVSAHFVHHFLSLSLPVCIYFVVMVPSAATWDAIRFQKVAHTTLTRSYLRSTDNNSRWPLLTFPCVNVKCAPLVFITFWFCWQAH